MPTAVPTATPTKTPSNTSSPTKAPSNTSSPTKAPSTTSAPTNTPTKRPTAAPTKAPFNTNSPTKSPSSSPTKAPSTSASPTKAPTAAPVVPPTKLPTKSPTRLPTKAPTKFPTKSPTKGPTKLPTIAPTKFPTKSPTKTPTKVPTLAPSPVPGNNVRATPFTVLYSPTPTSASLSDFMIASDITCAHVEDELRTNIAANPFISLVDITCRSTSTSGTPPTSTIQYETIVILATTSTVNLTPDDIDELIFVAFENPAKARLIADLVSLPSTNPFSATTNTVYAVATAPLVAPVVLESTNATTISGTYAVSIAGLVGMIALMITTCTRKCRADNRTTQPRHLHPSRPPNQSFDRLTFTTKSSSSSIHSHRTHSGIVDFLSSRHADYMANNGGRTSHDDNDPLLLPSRIRNQDHI